jgi:hypothetical protein
MSERRGARRGGKGLRSPAEGAGDLSYKLPPVSPLAGLVFFFVSAPGLTPWANLFRPKRAGGGNFGGAGCGGKLPR